MDALWVFAYGSLIWNPGFAVAERRLARAPGWHRSFCMKSVHYRGTPAFHGLVLALDSRPDAVCHGLALRVATGQEAGTRAYLRDRELSGSGYEEHLIPLETDAGPLQALAYVITPTQPDYIRLDLATQAAIIARAEGARGPNRDYLLATAAHLAELGIPDPELETLVAMVQGL